MMQWKCISTISHVIVCEGILVKDKGKKHFYWQPRILPDNEPEEYTLKEFMDYLPILEPNSEEVLVLGETIYLQGYSSDEIYIVEWKEDPET